MAPRPADGAPVVIEAAINGVTSRARNPHVPLDPGEIATDALACLAAGAAIVHNHIDAFHLTADAAAQRYLEGWGPVLRTRPDALLYPTVAAAGPSADRCAHLEPLAAAGVLRMGVLDPGSVNLGAADEHGLPAPPAVVYENGYDDVAAVVALLARLRLGPSIAIFEPGFLRATLAYHRAGRLPPGAFVKLYFGGEHAYFGGRGATFGLPPTRAALDAYLEMLEGSGLPWAVAVLGGDVVGTGLARLALERGGHVRVGLEDHADAGAPGNADQVAAAAALAGEVGRPVATPGECAAILALPAR